MYKGNCLVDVINNIKTEEESNDIISKYVDFKYLFIPVDVNVYNNLKSDITRYKLDKSLKFSIEQKYKISDISYIVAFGDTKASFNFINQYIPHERFVDTTNCYSRADKLANEKKGKFIYVYKCFYSKYYKESFLKCNVNIHEESETSWECLMQLTKHPSHGVIIKDYTVI